MNCIMAPVNFRKHVKPKHLLTLACFPLCLKVQKRPTNLRPCSRRCSQAKSVLGSWKMSEKSCLTLLRVAISVRGRELQERQYRHTKKQYDVYIMYICESPLCWTFLNKISSLILSCLHKKITTLEHLRMIVEACKAEAQNWIIFGLNGINTHINTHSFQWNKHGTSQASEQECPHNNVNFIHFQIFISFFLLNILSTKPFVFFLSTLLWGHPNLIFPKDLRRCEDVITNALWLAFNKSSRWFMEKLTLLEISSWPIFFMVQKKSLEKICWKNRLFFLSFQFHSIPFLPFPTPNAAYAHRISTNII